jgi:hypothetical protein
MKQQWEGPEIAVPRRLEESTLYIVLGRREWNE